MKFRFELEDAEMVGRGTKEVFELTAPAWDYKDVAEHFPEVIIKSFLSSCPSVISMEEKLEALTTLFFLLKKEVEAQVFGNEKGSPASEKFFNDLVRNERFLTDMKPNIFDGKNTHVAPELQEGKPRENPLNRMLKEKKDDGPEYDTGSGWVDPE